MAAAGSAEDPLFVIGPYCMYASWVPSCTLLLQINKGSIISIGMGIFRPFMMGKFDTYLLWSLGKSVKINKRRAYVYLECKSMYITSKLMDWWISHCFCKEVHLSPAFRAFCILVPGKNHVTQKSLNGTVVMIQLTRNSPTYADISKLKSA